MKEAMHQIGSYSPVALTVCGSSQMISKQLSTFLQEVWFSSPGWKHNGTTHRSIKDVEKILTNR